MSNCEYIHACTLLSSDRTDGGCAVVGLQVHFADGQACTFPDLGGDACAVGRFAGRLIGQTLPADVLSELVTDYLEERYGA